jgi:RNA polymerase sigma-70 factor (ECF subfamily)
MSEPIGGAEGRPPGSGELPALGRSLELARRAQAGEAEALDELLRRYQERVVRIARIRMGSRLRTCMESMDLVQETWRTALGRFQDLELRSHASLIQWLSKILENQIHDAVTRNFRTEKRARDRERPLSPAGESGDAAALEPAGSEPAPADALAETELREIYDACVEELEGDQREVVLLREYAGASWELIARELGRARVEAAQELYRRARIRLAGIVQRRLGG